MPPFLIIYDSGVLVPNVQRIKKSLSLNYPRSEVLSMVLSNKSINKILNEVEGYFSGRILILLSHCYINEQDGVPSYFSGSSCPEVEDQFSYICKQFKHVWMAGCSTANLPITLYDLPNIHSFVIDGEFSHHYYYEAEYIPVVSINWLVEFFNLMARFKFEWWSTAPNSHPLRIISTELFDFVKGDKEKQDSYCKKYSFLELPDNYYTFDKRHQAIEYFEACLRNYLWRSALTSDHVDEVLYPYHLSFPEIFHFGVLVAHFPNDGLQVKSGKNASNSYEKFNKEKNLNSTKDANSFVFNPAKLFNAANTWFKNIGDRSTSDLMLQQNSVCIKSAFEAALFHSISDFLPQVPGVFRNCQSELQRTLIGAQPRSRNDDARRSFAVVCRNVTRKRKRKVNDPRISINEFVPIAEKFIRIAVKYGFNVVLIDSSVPSLLKQLTSLPPGRVINCTEHSIIQRRNIVFPDFANNEKDEISSQLKFLQRCIADYNIVGAFGVHGGMLDVLNVLGVPTQSTSRFFGPNRTNDHLETVSKWMKRTHRLLELVCGVENTSQWWMEAGCPTDHDIEQLFANGPRYNF